MSYQAALQTDYYKIGHPIMFPDGTSLMYNNFTPRKSRIPGISEVVVTNIQAFIKRRLIKDWKDTFFNVNKRVAIAKYKRIIDNTLGKDVIPTQHLEDLWDLRYLPIEIKALPEGTLCPIGVPLLTYKSTHPVGYFLPGLLETILSTETWQPITIATLAHEFRKLLDKYALETTGSTEGVQWQGHDFSMRGMAGLEAAAAGGFGHLLSFTGTDTIPAVEYAEEYYGANVETELIGASVPATEHSVMCMGQKDDELGTFRTLLEKFPKGILSVVSDTWDLWKVLTEYLPALKEEILTRDGKLVIRPDSGNPVDILCGLPISEFESVEDAEADLEDSIDSDKDANVSQIKNTILIRDKKSVITKHVVIADIEWLRERGGYSDNNYYVIEDLEVSSYQQELLPSDIGVIELLWLIFGGTVNDQGYKVLDPHIGAIYGDSIDLKRAEEICERLKAKGFASTNIVFGIGSYSYQYNTRDTFGFAVKATYGEVNTISEKGAIIQEAREIWKDPITDDGTKKSAKGLLKVYRDEEGKIRLKDQCTFEEEAEGLLERVFLDGKLTKEFTLAEVRANLGHIK